MSDHTIALVPPPPKHVLVNGKPIKFRAGQQVIWIATAGAAGAALIAGWYFNLLEVVWHVHFGAFYFSWDHLKLWWDNGMGFIHSRSWPLYRHNVRNLGEPAGAVMGIKTLLVARRYWNVRVGIPRVVVTPFVLIAVALALIVGGTWLLDFGLPHAWHALHFRTLHGPLVTEWGKFSVSFLILGFLIGQVLHHIWAPVGATLNGDLLDRSVDHYSSPGMIGSRPLWVRWPLAPPIVRERWSQMLSTNMAIKTRKRVPRWIVWVILVLSAYFVVTGIIGHFWVGVMGHSFPYLAP